MLAHARGRRCAVTLDHGLHDSLMLLGEMPPCVLSGGFLAHGRLDAHAVDHFHQRDDAPDCAWPGDQQMKAVIPLLPLVVILRRGVLAARIFPVPADRPGSLSSRPVRRAPARTADAFPRYPPDSPRAKTAQRRRKLQRPRAQIRAAPDAAPHPPGCFQRRQRRAQFPPADAELFGELLSGGSASPSFS